MDKTKHKEVKQTKSSFVRARVLRKFVLNDTEYNPDDILEAEQSVIKALGLSVTEEK